MNSLFITKPCPICGSKTFSVLMKSTYHENLTKNDLKEIYSSSSDHMLMDQLVKCDSCNLVYINPQVRSDIVMSSYTEAVDETFIKQNPLRITTFQRNLLSLCRRLNIQPTKEKSVLDIGCAGGAFPVAANNAGFSVVGIEPSRWLSEQARNRYGLDIRTGPLEAQDFGMRKFDLITLWDVIEHLTAPVEVIQKSRELLSDGGLLIVNYPDYDSYACKVFGKRWPFFLSVHLIYFTPDTIRRFLSDQGFEVILIRPYWQTLELGYALERASAYFGLFKILAKLTRILGLAKLPLRYNMGQTLLVARKKDETSKL